MSFTVPTEFKDDLDYVASRLGVSKSAVLHQILSSPLHDISVILRDIPDMGVPMDKNSAPAKRFKNASIAYINEAVSTLSDAFGSDLGGIKK